MIKIPDTTYVKGKAMPSVQNIWYKLRLWLAKLISPGDVFIHDVRLIVEHSPNLSWIGVSEDGGEPLEVHFNFVHFEIEPGLRIRFERSTHND